MLNLRNQKVWTMIQQIIDSYCVNQAYFLNFVFCEKEMLKISTIILPILFINRTRPGITDQSSG